MRTSLFLLFVAMTNLLAGCTTVSNEPAPPPSAAIEVRAEIQADGSVGVYSFGEPILPVYKVVGKFTARAIASIPPTLHIYLVGNAYVEPTSGAHVDAVRKGRVVIYRDGVPIDKMGAGFALPTPAAATAAAKPHIPSPVAFPPDVYFPPDRCPGGVCTPPLPWETK